MKTTRTAADAYAEAHARVIAALSKLSDHVDDIPAPENVENLHWGHAGDIMKLAFEIENIIPRQS